MTTLIKMINPRLGRSNNQGRNRIKCPTQLLTLQQKLRKPRKMNKSLLSKKIPQKEAKISQKIKIWSKRRRTPLQIPRFHPMETITRIHPRILTLRKMNRVLQRIQQRIKKQRILLRHQTILRKKLKKQQQMNNSKPIKQPPKPNLKLKKKKAQETVVNRRRR